MLTGIVAVVAFNGINLMEAYGGGAPHYARTTNMDKWVDPLPTLYITDSVTVALAAGYLLGTKRRRG